MDTNKFKSLVHYVCHQTTEKPEKLGATKLNKVLWFSDLLSYIDTGKSITDEVYVKRQFGPVPKNILNTLNELIDEKAIAVQQHSFHGFIQKHHLSLKDANDSFMDETEKSIVNDVMNAICENHTANSISHLTHTDLWDMAEDGEELPHYTAFSISAGTLTDQDLEWANDKVKGFTINAYN
ncbi:MAG: Panacea domain-containing protein [Gammaproteobacteria bacterium]|nr:Panacea domain-containing protein [Gammaproteobacteria bacterium]